MPAPILVLEYINKSALQAREVLESLIGNRDNFHALTFNLSTIYELCTERSRALKIGLAENVAGTKKDPSQVGMGTDGTHERPAAWEKVNSDFKL